jgi:hypothetical protein
MHTRSEVTEEDIDDAISSIAQGQASIEYDRFKYIAMELRARSERENIEHVNAVNTGTRLDLPHEQRGPSNSDDNHKSSEDVGAVYAVTHSDQQNQAREYTNRLNDNIMPMAQVDGIEDRKSNVTYNVDNSQPYTQRIELASASTVHATNPGDAFQANTGQDADIGHTQHLVAGPRDKEQFNGATEPIIGEDFTRSSTESLASEISTPQPLGFPLTYLDQLEQLRAITETDDGQPQNLTRAQMDESNRVGDPGGMQQIYQGIATAADAVAMQVSLNAMGTRDSERDASTLDPLDMDAYEDNSNDLSTYQSYSSGSVDTSEVRSRSASYSDESFLNNDLASTESIVGQENQNYASMTSTESESLDESMQFDTLPAGSDSNALTREGDLFLRDSRELFMLVRDIYARLKVSILYVCIYVCIYEYANVSHFRQTHNFGSISRQDACFKSPGQT